MPRVVAAILEETVVTLRRLGNHHDSSFRHKEALTVTIEVVADFIALGNLYVLVNYSPSNLGVPSDFEIAQFCWKPDYDSYFYQQLKKRSQNVYFLRDQFIFQLPRAIVVEIPQLGHATYIFTKPPSVREFVHKYAITSRDDIRKNRGNVAQQLGFIARVMHGSNPRRWAGDLRARIGETPDYSLFSIP